METTSQAEVWHHSSCNKITEKKNLDERLLHLAVRLFCLQTGEDYAIMKKFGNLHNRCNRSQISDWKSRTQSSIMEFSPSSLIPEKTRKIIEVTQKIIELLMGEVPIRCQDVTVYFSMEEWEYLEDHKDLYKEVMMKNQQLFRSIGNSERRSEKICETGKLLNHTADVVLNVTKDLIDLLTGESYILVQKSRTMRDKQSSGYLTRCQDTTMEPLNHPQVSEGDDKKILEVIQKIIELLTGEVPIRCQDVSVYFSMEEWEYLEGHKELYKDVTIENQQMFRSIGGAPPVYKPDGYPFTPHHTEDGDQTQSKEVRRKDGVESADNVEPLISEPDGRVQDIDDNTESPVSNKADCSKKKKLSCSECGRCYSNKYTLKIHQQIHTSQSTQEHYFCPYLCKKSFNSEIAVQRHLYSNHTCSVCKQEFSTTSELEDHTKNHPELKRKYTCGECGKYFLHKGNLKTHYRIHTGEKPFPCLECGKVFTYKSHLLSHQRFHTGEVLTCRFCDQVFVDRSHWVFHERVHTGEKPFVCSECGRSFSRNSQLTLHHRTHTNICPYQCSACGKRFTTKVSAEMHWNLNRCKKRRT